MQQDRNQDQIDSAMLVAYRSHLFAIYSDLQIHERGDDYDALGSGSWYALGSLYSTKGLAPLERVMRALNAAAYHNNTCGEPFSVRLLHPDDACCRTENGGSKPQRGYAA